MKMTKTYKKGFPWDGVRKKEEAKLFADGWVVVSEKHEKKRSIAGGCILFLIFMPLALIPIYNESVVVEYEKKEPKPKRTRKATPDAKKQG